MVGLVPTIHVFACRTWIKTQMLATRASMTYELAQRTRPSRARSKPHRKDKT